jgi:hypothetical protein
MVRWHELGGRMRMLFRRRRLVRELDEEPNFHLERVAGSLRESGLSEDAAAREAWRQFGNSLRVREKSVEAWGWGWLESVIEDVRFGGRMLLRRPVFSLVVISVLALGHRATGEWFDTYCDFREWQRRNRWGIARIIC